jgi:predicted ATP-grasp superfamily ATP-dependent carboligase
MGWIAACVLLVMLLPLLGTLYVDVLQTKHEAKQQVEKVEKLRRQVEQQQKKGSKDE